MSAAGQHSSERREPCGLPTPKSTSSFWHSEPIPLLVGHRSTRDLPETADVVIIGSGMTGTSAAQYLLEKDGQDQPKVDVVMLEAREACWGATGRNGGHCQPILFDHAHDPSRARFEFRNYDTIHALVKAKEIDCEFVSQPGVHSTFSERQLDEYKSAMAAVQSNAPDLASRMRLVTDCAGLLELRVPAAHGAIVIDTAARLWPYKFVGRILVDLLTATGLNGSFNLQTITPVTKIHEADQNGRVVVQTERGNIAAKKVIVATNGYTSHLLPEFADLIVPCRGQMSALVPFPSVAGEDRLRTSLSFVANGLDDYLMQRSNEKGAHLMFGGGRQAGPSMGVTDDSVVDENVATYLQTRLTHWLNLPEGGSESSGEVTSKTTKKMEAKYMWTGIMGYSRDETPWVGPVPGAKNVYMAAGFTGHGMPNTWLSGQAAARIVELTLAGEDEAAAVKAASEKTGLPDSFRITKDRIERALELESVEAVDRMDQELGRRDEQLFSQRA